MEPFVVSQVLLQTPTVRKIGLNVAAVIHARVSKARTVVKLNSQPELEINDKENACKRILGKSVCAYLEISNTSTATCCENTSGSRLIGQGGLESGRQLMASLRKREETQKHAPCLPKHRLFSVYSPLSGIAIGYWPDARACWHGLPSHPQLQGWKRFC